MADNQIKILIAADTQAATSNLIKLATGFKMLSDELQKPLGQIDSFVTLKKSLTENETALKSARDRVAEMAGQMKAVGPLPQGFSESFARAKKEAGDLEKTVSKQQEALHRLRQSMQASGVDTTKLASEQLRLKAALKEATDEFQKYKQIALARDALGVKPHQELRQEIDRLKQSYLTLADSGKLSFSELAQAKVSLSEKIRDLKTQTNGWSEGIEKARGAIIGLVAAAATIKSSVTAAMEFEAGLAGVAKVVDAPNEKIVELGENILMLTRVMPQSAKELLQIAEAGGQMGLAADEIEAFVTATAKIATAFKIPAQEAGEAIGTLKNIYKLTIPEIVSLADAINVLGNNLETSEAKIIHVLTRAGAMPRLFGLSETQAAALAAAMTSLGITEEQAGTAITAFLSKLKTLNVASDDVRDSLTSIGIDLTQFAKDIEANPQQALMRFLETLKKLSTQKQMEVLKVFAGEEYQRQIGTLLDGLDKYKQALGFVSDKTKYAGSSQKEFEEGLKTLTNKVDLAKNSVVELGVRLGNLEVSKAAVDGFTALTKAINDFVKTNPELSQIALGAATLTASLGALRLLGGGALTLVAKGFDTLVVSGTVVKGLAFEVELLIANFVKLGNTASTIAGGIGLLSLALADILAVGKIGELWKLLGEDTDATKQTAGVIKKYQELAESLKQYKDFKLQATEDLKLMDAGRLQAEYDSLKKSLDYWKAYREQLELQLSQMPEHVGLGEDFTDPNAEGREEVKKQLEETKQKLNDLMEAFKRTGEAARANGVDLVLFGQSAEKAGAQTSELSNQTSNFSSAVRLTKSQVDALIGSFSDRYSAARKSAADYYDFATRKTEALAKTEEEAAQVAIENARRKALTLIGLDEEEAARKKYLIKVSGDNEEEKAKRILEVERDLKKAKQGYLDDYQKALESSYIDAVKKEKAYAQEVKALEQSLFESKQSFTQKIQDIRNAATQRGIDARSKMEREALAKEAKDKQDNINAQMGSEQDKAKAIVQLNKETDEAISEIEKEAARRAARLLEEKERQLRNAAYETLKQAEDAALFAKNTEGYARAIELAKQAASEFDKLKGSVSGDAQAMIGITRAQGLVNDAIESQISLKQKAQEAAQAEAQATSKALGDVQQAQNNVNQTPLTVKVDENGVIVIEQVQEKLTTLGETTVNPKVDPLMDTATVDGKIQAINAAQIQPRVTFNPDTTAIDAAIERISRPIHVKVIYDTSGAPDEGGGGEEATGERWGGLIAKLATGGNWARIAGQLPGWGGGDRIRALLEAGEYVVRKEAVARYGSGFFEMLNNMSFSLPELPAMPQIAFAGGGQAQPVEDFGTLNLTAGNAQLPVTVRGPNAREQVIAFERELKKMQLVRGR